MKNCTENFGYKIYAQHHLLATFFLKIKGVVNSSCTSKSYSIQTSLLCKILYTVIFISYIMYFVLSLQKIAKLGLSDLNGKLLFF